MARHWRHKINIKQFLDDSDPLEVVLACIRGELLNLPHEVSITIPDSVMESFKTAVAYNSIDDFDDALDMLYDWADDNDVWLGP